MVNASYHSFAYISIDSAALVACASLRAAISPTNGGRRRRD